MALKVFEYEWMGLKVLFFFFICNENISPKVINRLWLLFILTHFITIDFSIDTVV